MDSIGQDIPLIVTSTKDPFQRAGRLWVYSLLMVYLYLIDIWKDGKKKLLTQSDLYNIRAKDNSNASYKQYNAYYERLSGDKKNLVLPSLLRAFYRIFFNNNIKF